MLYSDIPKVLFSSIKEDDPHRDSKLFQIERWCYANWDLHKRSGKKGHNFLAKVLSSDDCWKKVDNIHGVKLDRRLVGKKLVSFDSPFIVDRYKIACRCCLEEDINDLFEERKRSLAAQGKSSLLEYDHLVACLGTDLLSAFWSHFISGYIDKLEDKINGRHPYEYGLDCAVDLKKLEAVEFFWNKIKSLPENELNDEKKGEIFMDTAVRTAGGRYNSSCPEMFEFCFSQISVDRYKDLIKKDFNQNGHYGGLNALQSALCFDQFKELFDCLGPSDLSSDKYYNWLSFIEIHKYSEIYVSEGIKLFMHIWMREGFDDHRAFALNEEMRNSSVFQGRLLSRLVDSGCEETVYAVLNKATPSQIKEFMSSEEVKNICSVLEKRNDGSLDKFLSYSKSVTEEDKFSTDLNNIKLSEVDRQLGRGLYKQI